LPVAQSPNILDVAGVKRYETQLGQVLISTGRGIYQQRLVQPINAGTGNILSVFQENDRIVGKFNFCPLRDCQLGRRQSARDHGYPQKSRR
jgi:hypothetical protein